MNLVLKNCRFGKGAFTLNNTFPGEKLIQFRGQIINRFQLPNPYMNDNDYSLQIGNELFLGPSGKVDDYVNHSCQPNCAINISNNGNLVRLVAITHIEAGQEVFFQLMAQ